MLQNASVFYTQEAHRFTTEKEYDGNLMQVNYL